MSQFHSGSDTLAAHAHAIVACKRPQLLAVRFSRFGETVATLEGPVPAAPGDAILTGPSGEQWPVARARFTAKYTPLPPLACFDDGSYHTLTQRVLALRLGTAFSVLLDDGATTLQGQAGDWLIDYGDRSLGVVSYSLFDQLYEPLTAPPRRARPMALHGLIKRLLLAGSGVHKGTMGPSTPAPASLAWLIAACAPSHRSFNASAIRAGDRYRSAYWMIYLLSAFAALLATLPAALGWDLNTHSLHSYAGWWSMAEVLVIASVGLVYWRGHQQDWQGQWLVARTHAELSWYLPLVAPLVDFARAHPSQSWYARVFNPGQHVREANDIGALCAQLEQPARNAQLMLWSEPAAVRAYGLWAISLLRGQCQYHQRAAAEQHALQHRVHMISTALFFLTAAGAAMHLFWHSLWLSMVTVFFPALGAALHGALAQSEAYRLEQSSKRLAAHLAHVITQVEHTLAAESPMADSVAEAVQGAVAVILDEHQDWHGAVRPHHIPLG
ncbi:MAG: PGDYG domain-containing protein [Pseudomonadota bacterium]